MIEDYSLQQGHMTIFYENKSASGISKNPVQHSCTKHHFIQDLVKIKTITMDHVVTEKQLVDIFIKPLDSTRYEHSRGELGLCQV